MRYLLSPSVVHLEKILDPLFLNETSCFDFKKDKGLS